MSEYLSALCGDLAELIGRDLLSPELANDVLRSVISLEEAQEIYCREKLLKEMYNV